MIRIGIAEDDPACAQLLTQFLDQYTRETGETFEVKLFANGEELTFDYQPVFDILFMDIEMPRMDGMTAARKVRECDSKVIIFFITSMAQYALEGYQVRARAYLLKPLNYTSLSLELQDALASISSKKDQFLLLHTEDGLVKIPEGKIIYVETDGHDLLFHTKDRILRTRSTVREMEQQLSSAYFVRSHASFIVNLAYVTDVYADAVNVDGMRVPIARNRRKAFLQALSEYVGRG